VDQKKAIHKGEREPEPMTFPSMGEGDRSEGEKNVVAVGGGRQRGNFLDLKRGSEIATGKLYNRDKKQTPQL